ncbi:DUF1403 family protein [Rhizobium anhuiense]|nr:DUF1403 family protein [Rhizobium leguminosarum bv. viciae]NKM58452.1 DUF1403 family protein [Rhizobium anhuiense]
MLTAAGDDPGPSGRLFLAMRLLSRRSNTLGSPFIKELATLFGIRWDDGLAAVPDRIKETERCYRDPYSHLPRPAPKVPICFPCYSCWSAARIFSTA